jgi:triacylglycerol lipase
MPAPKAKKAKAKAKAESQSGEKHVVVLHGLAMNRLWMTGISEHLRKRGYTVHDISYPTRSKNFETLVDEHLAPVMLTIPAEKVDFVVHSMGGLMVRLYAAKYGAGKIGRVVMLGTPNHGSEVADFMKSWTAFGWYFGEVGKSLGTTAEDIFAKLPPVPFECGVIAGETGWLHFPTNALVDIPKPNDGIVSVESTKVPGMKEHIVIPADHSLMVWMPKIWKLASAFLETGSFKD